MATQNRKSSSSRDRYQKISVYVVRDEEQQVSTKVCTLLYDVVLKPEGTFLVPSHDTSTQKDAVSRTLSRFRTMQEGQPSGDYPLGVTLSDTLLVTTSEFAKFTKGVSKRLRGGVYHARPIGENESPDPSPLRNGSRVVVSYYNHRTSRGCWQVAVIYAQVESLSLCPAPPVKKTAEAPPPESPLTAAKG